MLTLNHILASINHSSAACLILHPDFTIAGVNEVFWQLSGLSPIHISGKKITHLFKAGKMQQTLQEALFQVLESKKPINLPESNVLLKQQDRHKIPVCCYEIYPVLHNKQVQYIVCKLKETTDSNPNKILAGKLQQQISSLLESTTDCFMAVDKNWTVTYWNKQAELLSGIPRKKIIKQSLWDICPGAITKKFHSEYQRAMTEHVSVYFEEYSPTLKTWIEASAFPTGDGLLVHIRDISKRKNTEKQLELEQKKYRNLFNSSPLPMWVYDAKTLKFLDVNEAAITHYGYSREEFLTLTLKDIRPKEEVPLLIKALKNIKAEYTHKSEVRHLKKNGKIISVTIESNAIPFENRNARIVSVTDITEKLAAEQALKISERRFRALIQDSSDLISILDADGNFQYASPGYQSITGSAAENLISKNIFNFIHEADREHVMRQFKQLQRQKRIQFSPYRVKFKPHGFQWMETIMTNMMEDDAVGGMLASSRDISWHVENERKLKESMERYNTVSKATSDAIWDWNVESNKIVWNRGIKEIFGHQPAEADTRAWWSDHVHPDDEEQVSRYLQEHIQHKMSRITTEYRFRCADGTYKHVLDRAFLLFDKTGKLIRIIGAMQDITERVNYIRAIEEQNQRLHEISWIQSHLVRAPLARLMGLSKALSENISDEKTMKELLQHLDYSATELDTIIRDIVSKAE